MEVSGKPYQLVISCNSNPPYLIFSAEMVQSEEAPERYYSNIQNEIVNLFIFSMNPMNGLNSVLRREYF